MDCEDPGQIRLTLATQRDWNLIESALNLIEQTLEFKLYIYLLGFPGKKIFQALTAHHW